MKKIVLVLTLMFLSLLSFAQDQGQWGALYFKARMSDRFSYYAEHHIRFNNTELYKSYNRMGLQYAVAKNFSIVVGPAVIAKFNTEKETAIEYRIWHQYLYTHKIGRIEMHHQVRLEHVWFEGATWNRYRYKPYAYIPLNTREMEVGTVYFVPSIE
ncbi:DUF2490 domain-containing protein [Flammeovirga agarivorans]|uniref:DUF2490 domain-containing protein n=1 Tax=Flammeovirga agarivorans TaxID=2726742 RepID=A0A7X8XYJ7_9BACT|nr:DUF2490 domain-containing protein [Flammeovirga agarivorans]NLR94279.1 DUF2490 domain-containing protein [Flammeovirga agarivorans]